MFWLLFVVYVFSALWQLPEREVSAKITGSSVAELFLNTQKNDRFALVTWVDILKQFLELGGRIKQHILACFQRTRTVHGLQIEWLTFWFLGKCGCFLAQMFGDVSYLYFIFYVCINLFHVFLSCCKYITADVKTLSLSVFGYVYFYA